MDVSRYAHERWAWGATNEEDVAVAYVRLAIASHDPMRMLLPAVKAAVADEFRKERLKIEERVPWDNLLSPSRQTETTNLSRTKTATTTSRTYLSMNHPPSTLDAINDLLKTQLWVWRTKANGKPDGRMIPWAELTLDDIEPTIIREQDVISGHARRIERLEKARALMIKHEVTCFGDIPFSAEVRELIIA